MEDLPIKVVCEGIFISVTYVTYKYFFISEIS